VRKSFTSLFVAQLPLYHWHWHSSTLSFGGKIDGNINNLCV